MKLWGIVLGAMAVGTMACSQTQERPTIMAHADGDQHIIVRVEANQLWWSHRAWTEPHAMWRMPTAGPIDNLAVVPVASSEGNTFVVTFDQGGMTWRGRFTTDPLTAIDAPRAYLDTTERSPNEGSTTISELARADVR